MSVFRKLCALTIASVVAASPVIPQNIAMAADIDYSTALKDSIIFYDANKCGNDVAEDNFFSWRGACHTTDGKDVGFDLTGGYHDAGDHVKFGLPQAFSAGVLGWSLYEFKSAYDSVGNTAKLTADLKRFTDYFLKCHTDANTFYYQIGDGQVDHTYWGAPEEQPGDRPAKFVANASNPASDVLGETSAALSIMYLNYKGKDSAYAEKCLQASKELYKMGTTNLGYSNGQSFYDSSSFYDDLAWAATWLYTIEKDPSYLEQAQTFVLKTNKYSNDPMKSKWTMCWDDMYVPTILRLLQITGDVKYKDALEFNLNYWKNDLQKTPGGLRYLLVGGALKYATAESMLALIYYKQNKDDSLKDFAKSQIDYICGNNPANMSYIIGFGTNWPKHPHHRAANGYTYANGDNLKEAIHTLTGGLVGGPAQDDKFVDDGSQYLYTEVGLDYNASLAGALSGFIYANNGGNGNNDPKITLGDLDGNGKINSTDYVLLKRYVLEMGVNIEVKAADLNGDAKINSADCSLLKQFLLNKISKFPADK